MPEWLGNFTTTQVDPTLQVFGTRLLLAWLCGYIVAWLDRRKRPAGTADTLAMTLALMSILIAMVTQIIGDNVARAFSLVGALSIVRFRTEVPATRDVAFVLTAVAVGMAIGAGQYCVAGVGLLVVGLANEFSCFEADRTKSNSRDEKSTESAWRLTLLVGLSATEGWESEIVRFSESHRLMSAETTRRGGAMELVYRLDPRPDTNAVDLVAALNTVPTVESVATKVS